MMLRSAFVPIALLISSLASEVKAQVTDRQIVEETILRMSGTIGVTSEPVFSEGVLSACTLVYNSIIQDWKYRAGRFLKLTGSVGLYDHANGPAFLIKVVVNEIDLPGTPKTTTDPRPTRVYFLNDSLKTNLGSLVSSIDADLPGGHIGVYSMSPSIEFLMEAIQENRLQIAFNQGAGDTDLIAVIEPDVNNMDRSFKRHRSSEQTDSFFKCLGIFIENKQQ